MALIDQLYEILENTDKSSTELVEELSDLLRELIESKTPENEFLVLIRSMVKTLREKRTDLVIFTYIGNKISEIMDSCSPLGSNEIKKEISLWLDQFLVINDKTVDHACQYLTEHKNIKKIITLSYSKLVFKVLKNSDLETVYICESRPKNEGFRLAKDLIQQTSGVEIVLLPDALGSKVLVEKADALLLGMDAWFKDNSISNKTGSLGLALTAKYIDKPVLVIGNILKKVDYLPNQYKQKNFAEEFKKSYPNGQEKLSYLNEYFDLIPANLLTKILH